MAKKTMILLPDPSRLIEGLRDTGYDFNTAVADVIDNSVDAQASTIDVRILKDVDGEVVVDIIDDGCGMTEKELVDAMQYGAHGKKSPSRLGKFGLGLKTASTAFCKQLIVVSRKTAKQKPAKAVWDLEHVSAVNKWELIIEDPSPEELQALDEVTKGKNGTLVRWAKVDRIHDKEYAKKDGKPAQRALERRAEGLRSHVAMVYQRFLDPKDKRARTVQLLINGESVEAWDPFCREAKGTQKALDKTIPIELDAGGKAECSVRAFIVPRNEEFSTPAEAKKARIGNEYQGFFVYRENRMIHGPDWLGMSQKEPHASLCRIEFSFDHHLDEAFKVDIKKSEVHLNDDLFVWLKEKFVPGPKREAVERYRKGEKRKIQVKAGDAHQSSNAAIHAKMDDVTLSTTEVTNQAKGIVELTNKLGTFRLKLPLMTARTPGEVHVKAVASIDDGLLWAPCLIDGNHAVQINQNHPYYAKVYVPNLAEGVTIQGMDSLLWGLVEAELDATTDSTKKLFHELRYEVSKLLRTLVEDMPDPDLDGDDNE
jgi:hypothetical protein